MKATEHFKQTIKAYLDERAQNDELFAVSYAKESKNMDDCVTFILNHKKDNVEETEWLEVILWNNLASVAQQYYHTGDKVYVKGHLSSNSYEDKEGVTHNVTQIVADDIEKLSTAKRNIQEQSK